MAVHTLEAVVAVTILIIAVAAMFGQFGNTPRDSIGREGWLALSVLDAAGKLRPLVVSNDSLSAEGEVRNLLNENIRIEICSGSCTGISGAGEATVVDYLVSGWLEYKPTRIRLHIFR